MTVAPPIVWQEIAPGLPQKTRKMGQGFVDLCIELGAFNIPILCDVDLINDDEVMFDWDGDGRMNFTVLISSEPSMVCDGRLQRQRISCEEKDLRIIGYYIALFVNWNRQRQWDRIALSDSYWKRKSSESQAVETALYTPDKRGLLSVFTSDHSTAFNIKSAGKHVALESKKALYGWEYMARKIYEQFGLRIVPHEDGLSFGPCTHMEIQGWPTDRPECLRVSKELANSSIDRQRLKRPHYAHP